MDNLVIKIGADKRKELKAVFDNPQKTKKNTMEMKKCGI